MGQQQLLLLVLAAIIVGTGVLLGVNMFQENAAQANMDAVTQDCLTFAAKAQAWAKRPVAMGGGGQAFTGFDFGDINLPAGASYSNENGSFAISNVTATGCQITGTGKEDIDGGGALTATVIVTTNNVTVSQTK
jgi:hypothetical protein